MMTGVTRRLALSDPPDAEQTGGRSCQGLYVFRRGDASAAAAQGSLAAQSFVRGIPGMCGLS